MQRLAILALISVAAFAATPLKAAESAKPETPAVTDPCGTFDCSRLPGAMAKAMRHMPDAMAKAMENFKMPEMKLPGSCEGGKCAADLPAGLIPSITTSCKDGKC